MSSNKHQAIARTLKQASRAAVIQVTSDTIVAHYNNRNIRRLAGPKFTPEGRYIETVEWYLVEGVVGKYLSLQDALHAAAS